jgi:outer membrane protein OmpA-like peptidoglycan-associated protein
VYDVKTGQRLSALIDLIDLDSGKTISTLTTDRGGNYLVTLPVGKDYAFHVNHEGYLFYSDNFSLKKNDNDSAFQRNIGLQPLEINAHVVLKNIFFDFNQYDLKPASQADLDRLAKLLQDNPTLHIRISGYTDNVGSDKDNLVLSQKRAEAVVQYLTTHGVAAERLTAKGYGESDPVASNDTEAGRAQNRRTEFVITAK